MNKQEKKLLQLDLDYLLLSLSHAIRTKNKKDIIKYKKEISNNQLMMDPRGVK